MNKNAAVERINSINKIIEYLKNNIKNGDTEILTNDLLDEIVGKTIDSNNKTIIRKSIPFATDDYCIVPIQIDNDLSSGIKRTKFKFLSQDEYDNYSFTEQNFKCLKKTEIENIIKKSTDSLGNRANTKIKLKILTTCDSIKHISRHGFTSLNYRILSANIMESKANVLEILKMLVVCGVLENIGDKYKFVFHDMNEMITSVKQPKTDLIQNIMEISAKMIEIEKSAKQLESQLKQAKQDIKDFKKIEKNLENNVQGIMNDFMAKVKDVCEKYKKQKDMSQFTEDVNLISTNTVENIIKFMNVKSE